MTRYEELRREVEQLRRRTQELYTKTLKIQTENDETHERMVFYVRAAHLARHINTEMTDRFSRDNMRDFPGFNENWLIDPPIRNEQMGQLYYDLQWYRFVSNLAENFNKYAEQGGIRACVLETIDITQSPTPADNIYGATRLMEYQAENYKDISDQLSWYELHFNDNCKPILPGYTPIKDMDDVLAAERSYASALERHQEAHGAVEDERERDEGEEWEV